MSPEKRRRLRSKELPIEQWQEASKFLYEKMGIKLFTLIGGEPTAKRGIERLVAFINKELPGTEILLLTSGIPLLKNENLRRKLIESGMRNVIVSIDGIKEKPNLEIDLTGELKALKRGSQRKSVLGLYFLLRLRQEYPQVPFRFGAGCIVNKETLDLILPTYEYLAKHKIYLNLCPEQTICFARQSDTALGLEDRNKLVGISEELVRIKQEPGNFLMPSEDFLRQLPTIGIEQSYRCSERPFPSTIHLASDGGVPFCNWHRGNMEGDFNIMELVNLKRDFEEWLFAWRTDENGKRCSCSWTFPDRVGAYSPSAPPLNPNIWYGCI